MTSIYAILAMVVQQDLEIEQMDVKTAFLHGSLDIYGATRGLRTNRPDKPSMSVEEESIRTEASPTPLISKV